jgi:hypothetical protein
MSVVVIVADGARADTIADAIARDTLPAIARLARDGSAHTVSTVFPSVTGIAYTPFLIGRFPGPLGLPGLRWYDRARHRRTFPSHTRSYVGFEMRHADSDLDARAPTIFEIAGTGFSALNMIGRGLPRSLQWGRSARFAMRAARVHFRGNVAGWLQIDRDMAHHVVKHIREKRPPFTLAALLGTDKVSHSTGHSSTEVSEALRIVDRTVAEIRHDAERAGRWDEMDLWVVSDHGHSPVNYHDDLADLIEGAGFSVISHPWVFARNRDVAVMVSGNAMAHLYLELNRRVRPWWPELRTRWGELVALFLTRPSVDLVLLPHAPHLTEVRAPGRGSAMIAMENGRFSYRPESGDPLGIGAHESLTADESYDVAAQSDYPDAIVQIAHLAGSARAGEIILSARREWDFRLRYEPIPHVSSHGALHREHMLVPLVLNRPARVAPRRTTDIMPSALRSLRLPIPPDLDGSPFN